MQIFATFTRDASNVILFVLFWQASHESGVGANQRERISTVYWRMQVFFFNLKPLFTRVQLQV